MGIIGCSSYQSHTVIILIRLIFQIGNPVAVAIKEARE